MLDMIVEKQHYHTQYYNSFETLPITLFSIIYEFLNRESAENLSMASKNLKILTNFAPTWKKLCLEANILPSDFEKQIMILSKGTLEGEAKLEAEGKLDLWTAKSILSKTNPQYDEALTLLLKVIKNKQVPLAIRSEAKSLILKMKNSSEALVWMAEERLENTDPLITDEQALDFLQKAIGYATLPLRLRAEYCKAVFICEDRDQKSTYPLASGIFQKVKNSWEVNEDLRLGSAYHLLIMQAKGQIYCADLQQLAQDLRKLSEDDNYSSKRQAYCVFYLAEMVLRGTVSLMSTEEARQIIENALKVNFFPKNICRDAKRILGASLKGSHSEYTSEEKTSSGDFARTLQMKKKLGHSPSYKNNVLDVFGKQYITISSKTTNFFGQTIASCGSSLEREVLLLDPATSPLLKKHFEKIKKTVIFNKNSQTSSILRFVRKYVREHIFLVEDRSILKPKFKSFMGAKLLDPQTIKIEVLRTKIPCIPIDDFIAAKIGVCRHHALVTAYILDGLVKAQLLTGIAQIIRDDMPKGGAHVWASFTNKEVMMHTDTLWGVMRDLNKPEQKKALESLYGAEVIKREIKKIEKATRTLS